jgi:hypothetical protein
MSAYPIVYYVTQHHACLGVFLDFNVFSDISIPWSTSTTVNYVHRPPQMHHMSLVIQLMISFSCRTGIYTDLDRYGTYLQCIMYSTFIISHISFINQRDDQRSPVPFSAYDALRARNGHARQLHACVTRSNLPRLLRQKEIYKT